LNKFDAVVIGDANIDLIVAGAGEIPPPGSEIFIDQMRMHVGGGGALFAISLAKLGLRVAFNGILGGDGFGRYVRDQFAEYGIDTSMIRTSQTRNTGISIAFHPETDRSFITYAGSNLDLDVERIDLEPIAQGRHVHVTGYKGSRNHDSFMAMAKALKERGLTLSCDVGWDDTGEWFAGVFDLMRLFDVFFMNETEAFHYTGFGSIEESLARMPACPGHIVIKRGPEGAVALKNGSQIHASAYPVEAVDTTGAGDSFNAGYIYGYLSGMDAGTCLRYGNACGALSVGAYGGSTGSPDRESLMEFVTRHADRQTTVLREVKG